MKTTKQLPFMSVAICVFNGGKVVGRSIESLLAQDYPRDRFEVLVVDDGSTDNSFEVVSRYPVRVLRHAKNLGVGAARKTVLKNVKGDVCVCFDDDCIVEPDWLSTLARGYELPNANGVGSVLVEPDGAHSLVDRFMAAAESGQAPSLKLGASKNPLARFIAYVVDQVNRGREATPTEPYPVREMNTATSSFPIAVLKAVDGWDPSLRRMEDTDLCSRISKKFPNGNFYVVPQAKVVHDPKMSLKAFLKRTYVRGDSNLRLYLRRSMMPPVFPFPMIWVVVVVAGLFVSPLAALVALIVTPQLLYFWWPARAVRERTLWYFTFAYMQLAEELSTIAGLVRGYMILRREKRHA